MTSMNFNLAARGRRAAAAAALFVLAASIHAAPAVPDREPISIGILSDADSLPLLVAEAEGLFAEEGVAVRLVRFRTAEERDAALQAGAVDGATSDLVALALAAQAGFELRATGMTDGRYGIVAAPGSGIVSLADLAGAQVGVSSGTIVQFETETLLSRAGLRVEQIGTISIPNIQLRLEMLIAGQIKAACLPEPLLSAARARGALLLTSSSNAGLEAGVLAFRKASIDSKLDQIAAFYRAFRTAAKIINENNAKYRDFLVDKAQFPPEVRDGYEFIVYKRPRLPTSAEIAAVVAWMRGKGLAAADLNAARLIDGRPLERAFGGY
jgi:NitT/TauT family transport system substrate-binding protein